MKEIKLLHEGLRLELYSIELYSIESEPGDNTRYSYYLLRQLDIYSFVKNVSTFPFPISLYYVDIENISTLEECIDYIRENNKLEDVNPHTLLECIITIKEIHNKKIKNYEIN